ncbi:MAG: hypothetical protein ACP5TV_07230 [Anaerolineae bacterium]
MSTENGPQGQGLRPEDLQNLKQELKRLGEQVGEAGRLLWNSPHRRALEDQIQEGLKKVSQEFRTLFDELLSSETAEKVRAKAEETIQTAAGSPIVEDIQEAMTAGLRELNEELEKLLGKLNDYLAQTREEMEKGRDQE